MLGPPTVKVPDEATISIDATLKIVEAGTPFYKTWWFWTIVGGVVVTGAAVGIGVAVGRPQNQNQFYTVVKF